MSNILPSVPRAVTAPTPEAVHRFRLALMPKALYAAEVLICDAERELKRPRQLQAFGPLLDESDENDRQTAQAMYAKADKTVSSHAERMGSHLRSLS